MLEKDKTYKLNISSTIEEVDFTIVSINEYRCDCGKLLDTMVIGKYFDKRYNREMHSNEDLKKLSYLNKDKEFFKECSN